MKTAFDIILCSHVDQLRYHFSGSNGQDSVSFEVDELPIPNSTTNIDTPPLLLRLVLTHQLSFVRLVFINKLLNSALLCLARWGKCDNLKHKLYFVFCVYYYYYYYYFG